jgi:hypothetical protein
LVGFEAEGSSLVRGRFLVEVVAGFWDGIGSTGFVAREFVLVRMLCVNNKYGDKHEVEVFPCFFAGSARDLETACLDGAPAVFLVGLVFKTVPVLLGIVSWRYLSSRRQLSYFVALSRVDLST